MTATFGVWPRVGIFVAGLLLLGQGTGLRAADEENPLRSELLKLNSATTEDIQTAKLRALIKDKDKAKKLIAEAAAMMKEAKDKDEKPFNYNGTVIIGRAAHILKDYENAEKFYEHQIALAAKVKSDQKLLQAYDNLIDMYFEAKRYDDAVDACEKFLDQPGGMELENFKLLVIERMIQIKARQGKTDEALSIVKRLLDDTGNSWYFLQTKGFVQREAGKIDDAIKTYGEVLDKLENEKNLKAEARDKMKDRVRYVLSGLHVENKDIEKAAKELQILVKRNPDMATYKNDLGFIWCDNDMNLEESEKLIKEAIELDKKEKEKLKEEGKLDEVKENAAYLDSLGWVLFKQKKFKEALEPLKKATQDEEDGNHLEIWDHLADAYSALGQKKEAIAAWEKALKMEDLSKRDGERRRKVSEKLRKARAEAAGDK